MPSQSSTFSTPGFQDADGLLLLVDLVVALAVLAAAQPGGDLGELGVPARALLGRAADDQRGPRLVDQDRVHLVDDRVVVAALHAVLELPGHVVAQVVEAELVVGAVGDVGGVLLAAGGRVHVGEDHAHLEAEEAVHPAHPLRVALGQVVVDRDDVHALAGQRVEVGREHAGRASCPRRSSSPRCCPGAARRRPSAGRRRPAGRGCAWRPRARRRRPRAGGRRAFPRRRTAAGTRR